MGQYEYVKMPFGLCNAPIDFQRFINEVFKDLIRKHKVLVYIDDILIATQSIEEHLEILQEVFNVLHSNCLELRIDKCHFAKIKKIVHQYLNV